MNTQDDAAGSDARPPWEDGSEAGAAPAPQTNEVADEVVDAPAAAPASQITEYNQTAAALAELRERLKGKTYDLTTTAGDKLARADRLELTRLISALEAKRQEVKAPILDRGKLIDAEARRITAELEALRDPIDKAIRAAEAEADRKREARIEAERQRRNDLRERIAQISAVARRAIGKPSAEIEAKISLLVAIEIGDDFGDFKPEAEAAHAEALATMRELLEGTKAQEAEAARLAAERAELDRQRAEQEAAAQAERDRQAALVLAEEERQAAARAELERQQAEARAAQAAADAAAAAAREEADRIAAAARAEAQARIDADRAQLAAQQAEQERQAREAREAQEREAEAARQEVERKAREAREAEEARQAQERAAQAAREAKEAARLAQLHANAQRLLEAAVVGVQALMLAAKNIRTLAAVHGAKSTAADEAEQAALALSEAVDAATVVDAELPSSTPEKPRRAQRAKPAGAGEVSA